MGELPTGTMTFLFTDIEDSTRLWDEHADQMQIALERHDEILRTAIAHHGGYVFSTAGDAFSASFASVRDACASAVESQTLLAAEAWPESVEIRVRMGLHVGEAHERDGDYFGLEVGRAARIMSLAHGGQIALSAGVSDLLTIMKAPWATRDLGEHRLSGMAGTSQVFQLEVPGLRNEFPALRSSRQTAGWVPPSLDRFRGRIDELSRMDRLLERTRLVTVIGPGGIGKTRFITHVAQNRTPTHTGGAWFVDLSAVLAADAVPHVVGSTLGVGELPGHSMTESIVRWIGDKDVLLILDNCEQVLESVRQFVEAVLSQCPLAKLLSSSREPIGHAGEQRFPLGPLGSTEDSVGLFCDRARQLDPEFDPSLHIESIESICGQLDGIPLAIELAAARTRVLAPPDIARRLRDHLGLLSDKGQSRPERHRTLAAAIGWSTEGLDDNALILLRRLGYFVGGFTLDAAEQVCRFGSIGSVDVVDLLDELARRYLVMPAMAGDTSRFRILEPIRQLVVAQLSEAEADEVAGRHARWCAARANELQELLLSPDEASAYPEVRVELPNFRVAHRWALEFDPDVAAELVEGLLCYMFTRLHLEIADWYDRTLEVLDPDDPWYHRCLAGAVGAWTLRRRYQEVTAARDTIDQSVVPVWVMNNAKLMFALRDEATTGSLDAYDRLASEALENDDPFTATLALCWALRTDEALAVAEAAGIPSAIAHATYHSAIAALRHGDETKALGELARAIDQTRAIDMDLVLSRALVMWAALALRLGEDRSIAMAAAEEGREMLIRSGIPQGREGHLALAELFGTEKDVGALERWQQTRRSTFS